MNTDAAPAARSRRSGRGWERGTIPENAKTAGKRRWKESFPPLIRRRIPGREVQPAAAARNDAKSPPAHRVGVAIRIKGRQGRKEGLNLAGGDSIFEQNG